MLGTDWIETVQIHGLSERSDISIHKSVRPHLKKELEVRYRTSVPWWQAGIHSQRVHSSWSVTVFGCTVPFLWSPGKNVAVHLQNFQRSWEKAQCAGWVRVVTGLIKPHYYSLFLFRFPTSLLFLVARVSVPALAIFFFWAVRTRERLTGSLYTVINVVFSCIQSFCWSNFHFEMAVYPELAVLFSSEAPVHNRNMNKIFLRCSSQVRVW